MLKQRAKAAYVLLFAFLVAFFVYSSQHPGTWAGNHPFHLGLDLSGGTHLVYSADVSKISATDIPGAMASLRDVVERRVNVLGVSESLVQTQQGNALSSQEGAYKLIVELPGITDVDKAIKEIGATPVLEFKLATAAQLKDFQASTTIQNLSTTTQEQVYIALFKDIGLTGRMVSRASLQFNQTTGAPVVGLTFTSEGAKVFASTTKANIGNYIGIFLDGRVISAPVVQSEILTGQAEISGSFTQDEVQTLVRDLNFGALPVPITLLSTQTIGPTLGAEAVNGGIYSGIVALIIIAIFLIIWYRLPGLIAVIALGVYTVLMLALFKLIPVTLSAAGIAGFILSIGMAVDANILIFERMKEELRRGRGIPDAMREGFARAWTSIRDSNLSSIITGIILYYFGSSSIITGFALVFFIGVIVSMFSAITASRLFLYAVAPSRTTKLSTFLISNGFNFKK